MSKPRKSRSTARGTTFVNYSPAEAQGVKNEKGSARWLATDIPIQHLVQTPSQATQIPHIHHCGQIQDHNFKASNTEEQRIASALLVRYGLDTASLDELKARWSTRWSWLSKGSKDEERYERVLYQWYVPSVSVAQNEK